jgi:hypothetical protein
MDQQNKCLSSAKLNNETNKVSDISLNKNCTSYNAPQLCHSEGVGLVLPLSGINQVGSGTNSLGMALQLVITI